MAATLFKAKHDVFEETALLKRSPNAYHVFYMSIIKRRVCIPICLFNIKPRKGPADAVTQFVC